MSEEHPPGHRTPDPHDPDPAERASSRDFLFPFGDEPSDSDDADREDDVDEPADRGWAATRSAARRRPAAPRQYPVASRSEVLRAFLTSNVGGGLVALAAVLLIVVTLLLVHGNPGGDQQATADSPTAVSSSHRTPSASPTSQQPTATPSDTTSPTSTPSEPTRTSPAPAHPFPGGRPARDGAPTLSPAKLPVTVLNNTTITGLARQTAAQFAAAGWPVRKVGNFTGRIPVTTVYFTPGHPDEERAAHDLAAAFPQITRVLPRYEGLPSSAVGVVVVLAPDWTS